MSIKKIKETIGTLVKKLSESFTPPISVPRPAPVVIR